MDYPFIDGFRRALDRFITPDERRKLEACTKEIQYEQLAGHEISMRDFLIRLLIAGFGISKDEAALSVDRVLAGAPMPAELRQAMN